MHFSLLTTLTALVASTTALQTIYIGNKNENCGSGSVKGGRYDIWFSDSDVCQDGLIYGYPRFNTWLCEGNYTLLGHEGISFTGCEPPDYIGDYSFPTGVSDDGVPALTCVPLGDDEELIYCPNTCGIPDSPYSVKPWVYCS
ncbi:hypothetical protein P152DRAFT_462374 [Eremomyces bilateralis CBS 781.70]|uniref:Uncharacterized protein n=1 Tax=Eremomyces bilateralis CBS 781.70 TaxID=1392243 RepID=A0A6G1FS99_9PEZI|nr:uncharacterized protein P152DRAFT_462374 [Eremomyces bilateralis CBS 781.70]KAF1808657.1 hypothetical protein P152DRAFT_462374 [Eremomyces bilateralis CBS 781.70]